MYPTGKLNTSVGVVRATRILALFGYKAGVNTEQTASAAAENAANAADTPVDAADIDHAVDPEPQDTVAAEPPPKAAAPVRARAPRRAQKPK